MKTLKLTSLLVLMSMLVVSCSSDEGADSSTNSSKSSTNVPVITATGFTVDIDENPSNGFVLGNIQPSASGGEATLITLVTSTPQGAFGSTSNGNITVNSSNVWNYADNPVLTATFRVYEKSTVNTTDENYIDSINVTVNINKPAVEAIVSIPDTNFKAALVANTNIDTNGDGEVQESEALNYSSGLTLNNKSINDFTGLEAFKNITSLKVNGNSALTIDVSKNTKIKSFYFESSKFTTVNLSSNLALEEIYGNGSSLSSIDVSSNANLKTLRLDGCNLQYIDVTSNLALEDIIVSANQIGSIDVSNNVNLWRLGLNNNKVSGVLDLTANTKLTTVNIENNLLTGFDVSGLTSLELLSCNDNSITGGIDLSSNTSMNYFTIKDNDISALSVANGNNANFKLMDARNNSSLTCVEVDVLPIVNTSPWAKDATASYLTDCTD